MLRLFLRAACTQTHQDRHMYQQHELKLPKMTQSKKIKDCENTTEPLHQNQGQCQQSYSLSCLSACISIFHQKTEICYPKVPKFSPGNKRLKYASSHISQDSETNIQWIIKWRLKEEVAKLECTKGYEKHYSTVQHYRKKQVVWFLWRNPIQSAAFTFFYKIITEMKATLSKWLKSCILLL